MSLANAPPRSPSAIPVTPYASASSVSTSPPTTTTNALAAAASRCPLCPMTHSRSMDIARLLADPPDDGGLCRATALSILPSIVDSPFRSDAAIIAAAGRNVGVRLGIGNSANDTASEPSSPPHPFYSPRAPPTSALSQFMHSEETHGAITAVGAERLPRRATISGDMDVAAMRTQAPPPSLSHPRISSLIPPYSNMFLPPPYVNQLSVPPLPPLPSAAAYPHPPMRPSYATATATPRFHPYTCLPHHPGPTGHPLAPYPSPGNLRSFSRRPTIYQPVHGAATLPGTARHQPSDSCSSTATMYNPASYFLHDTTPVEQSHSGAPAMPMPPPSRSASPMDRDGFIQSSLSPASSRETSADPNAITLVPSPRTAARLLQSLSGIGKPLVLPEASPRPFVCSICTKMFATEGHLKRHHGIHSGRRDHVCIFPGCFAAFNRRDNLLQHQRIHPGMDDGKRRRRRTKSAAAATSTRRTRKVSAASSADASFLSMGPIKTAIEQTEEGLAAT